MKVRALFNKKREEEIRRGLKKGRIPPRARPGLPQPASHVPPQTEYQKNEIITQLIEAAKKGDLEEVKDALAKGAGVDDADITMWWTALILTSKNGHVEIMRLLLEGGIDIDVKNKFGISALAWASQEGHTEIVEMLRGHGAKE